MSNCYYFLHPKKITWSCLVTWSCDTKRHYSYLEPKSNEFHFSPVSTQIFIHATLLFPSNKFNVTDIITAFSSCFQIFYHVSHFHINTMHVHGTLLSFAWSKKHIYSSVSLSSCFLHSWPLKTEKTLQTSLSLAYIILF